MSPRKTFATAGRVLQQLLHDPRTLALILLVPIVLLTILKYAFQGEPAVFNGLAPQILGIFPLVIMFIVTSIATLRERTIGTLDRLMTMPISKLDFIFGYAQAFAILAIIQAILASTVVLGLLGVTVAGGVFAVMLTARAIRTPRYRAGPVLLARSPPANFKPSSLCRPSSFRSCLHAGCLLP